MNSTSSSPYAVYAAVYLEANPEPTPSNHVPISDCPGVEGFGGKLAVGLLGAAASRTPTTAEVVAGVAELTAVPPSIAAPRT